MKYVVFIVIIFCIFFSGLLMGQPSKKSIGEEIQNELDEFDNKNNSDYKGKTINGNIINGIGSLGENTINKIFKYSFTKLEKLINN